MELLPVLLNNSLEHLSIFLQMIGSTFSRHMVRSLSIVVLDFYLFNPLKPLGVWAVNRHTEPWSVGRHHAAIYWPTRQVRYTNYQAVFKAADPLWYFKLQHSEPSGFSTHFTCVAYINFSAVLSLGHNCSVKGKKVTCVHIFWQNYINSSPMPDETAHASYYWTMYYFKL